MSRFSWLITVWADCLPSGICLGCKQCRVIQDVLKECYWIAASDTSVLHHWRPDLGCTQLDPAQEDQGDVSNSWGSWKPPHVPWWPPTVVPWNTSCPRSSPPGVARAQNTKWERVDRAAERCSRLVPPSLTDVHTERSKISDQQNGLGIEMERLDVWFFFFFCSVRLSAARTHFTAHDCALSCTKHLFQPTNMGQGTESQIWVWLNMRNHCLTATSPIKSDISPRYPSQLQRTDKFSYCLITGGFWVSLWSSRFFSSTLVGLEMQSCLWVRVCVSFMDWWPAQF